MSGPYGAASLFYPLVPSILESVLQPCKSVGVKLDIQFSCSFSHWSQAAWLRMAVPLSKLSSQGLTGSGSVGSQPRLSSSSGSV